ncbi:tRNA pseudouridine(38-40) synthase TruA [Algicola sagamiensis]|uniref:tRNA pseudouridine(38-40) synthase TruA n=1 Tax=Algicola sagamiensis TaxID=163869 RepID=UPI00037EA0EB|nr:tRNA pseudouridine(38-40) synthase TruA [Algicola sagamiensis]
MRIALGIEYDGCQYFGWQRQREVDSVQERIETALSTIADHPVEVFCAGRTDAGVHATNQVIHFDTTSERNIRAWTLGMNSNLPDGIAVKWAKPVDDDFHARFSATARRYRYIIYNHPLRPGIHQHGLSHYHYPLDAERMHEAAQCLIGEHDFSAFRAVQCQSKSKFRNMIHLRVERLNDFVIIDIKANAFLHHMVRNITGSLIEVGKGKQDISWIKALLDGKDRNLAAATAKAGGLYLVSVDYPEECGIPMEALGPLFLPNN